MTAEYFVKTDQFEGPLDLLLHLIRVHEIDIFAIDVLLLTREYLSYLRLMQFDDLQQAGEFLEMAATLIEIKTRMLLPHDEKEGGDEDGDDDPIRSLQERLLQYETFRNVAEHFRQMPQMGVEIQPNNEWNRLLPLYEHIEAPLTGEAATLVVLYEQMLRDLSERKKAKVTAKVHRISVEEMIDKLYSSANEGNEPVGLATRVRVYGDIRTNSVVVQARPRDLVEVESLIKKLDVAESGPVSQLKIIPLKYANADELSQTLRQAIQIGRAHV